MAWYIFGILGALFDASYYALVKKLLKHIDQYVLASGVFLGTSAVLVTASLFKGLPQPGPHFIPAVLATGTLNVLAAILYFKSLQITDLSLSIPMISFTPVFLILTSFILLKELPSVLGAVGIVLIVAGSYAINTSHENTRFFDPFKNMICNRGVLYMLVVAFLFSISSNIDKIVVRNSDTIFGSAMIFLYVGVVFLFVSTVKSRGVSPALRHGWHKFLAAGAALALAAITINIAYTSQIVPYVISLKRLSIVFVIFFGTLAFKEKNFFRRFIGACIMFAGVVLIVIF